MVTGHRIGCRYRELWFVSNMFVTRLACLKKRLDNFPDDDAVDVDEDEDEDEDNGDANDDGAD